MSDFTQVLAEGFDDELEKLAFFKKLRERIFGPKVEGDPDVIEDESKVKGAFGRFGDFLGGFVRGETAKRKAQGMIVFPGQFDPQEQLDALEATIGASGGGAPIDVDLKQSGGSAYIPGENLVELTHGQLGTAYHEGGHVVGIESMPEALREPYINLAQASYNYGPRSGLALLPSAILDPPGKRRKLSKWGPLAALVPSLPMLFEEGRANVIGGLSAHKRGHIWPFLEEAVPSYAGYAAEAAAVPLGLYMIHRAKERRLAEAQKAEAEAAAEHPMPKAAAAALGFADEIEKLGGIKSKLLAGGLIAAPFVPGVAKRTLMSGAQNFNTPGRAPRFGYGNVTSEPSHFPLLEKIRFNPVVGGVADTVRNVGALNRKHNVTGTASDFWKSKIGAR